MVIPPAEPHWSENLALTRLQAQGLVLVCRNYNTRLGEIDLIMDDTEHLVFIEVRQRSHTRYGRPEETISPAKRQRLRRTATLFLQQHPALQAQACRFDVFAVTGDAAKPCCHWIRDAF
ncbi:MAG TPA: YraN family protein [Gammaproteobacteria bacterium]|nr:YraN family protein [Acidiferrobacteraceae bacterium]HCV20485.1 YraN family protein [Gammaproteobacteria bacterium]